MIIFIKKLLGGTPVNFKDLVSKGAIIVDVRSPGEFKSGHIPGSKNFPLDNIKGKVNELRKINKPLITVCRSGTRSGIARGILKSAGLEVYNGGPWNNLKNKIA